MINVFFCIDVELPSVAPIGLPEELWSSNNHVLEVLKWQTPVVVQVSLVYHLLTHHPHLVFCELVTGQFVQRLLQVWLTDEVVVVEILKKAVQLIIYVIYFLFFAKVVSQVGQNKVFRFLKLHPNFCQCANCNVKLPYWYALKEQYIQI